MPQPDLAVTATGAVLALGGASILLGIKPKLGTLGVIGFLAGVSPIMHAFWKDQDPAERMTNTVNFTKNLALAGAALALLAVEEPWPASVATRHPGPVEKIRRVVRRGRIAA